MAPGIARAYSVFLASKYAEIETYRQTKTCEQLSTINEMQRYNYSAYQNKSCCLCLMHIQFGMSSRNLPGSCCTHADNHDGLTSIHRDLRSNKTTISPA